MYISLVAYGKLKQSEVSARELATLAQSERDNIRKAYEEVNKQYEAHRKHFEGTIENLSAQLGASRGSQIHVTAELEGLRKIAHNFAREKERDGVTIARLAWMLEQTMRAGQQVQGDLEQLQAKYEKAKFNA